MKLKQTVLSLGVISAMFGGAFAIAPMANAENAENEQNEELKCSVLPDSICGAVKDEDNKDLESSGIWLLLIFVINVMTAGVGLVAVAMIAYAAFKYTTAQSDEGQTKEAKEMIRNVAIGIAVYALMWAVIQWLIPGRVFS